MAIRGRCPDALIGVAGDISAGIYCTLNTRWQSFKFNKGYTQRPANKLSRKQQRGFLLANLVVCRAQGYFNRKKVLVAVKGTVTVF